MRLIKKRKPRRAFGCLFVRPPGVGPIFLQFVLSPKLIGDLSFHARWGKLFLALVLL